MEKIEDGVSSYQGSLCKTPAKLQKIKGKIGDCVSSYAGAEFKKKGDKDFPKITYRDVVMLTSN